MTLTPYVPFNDTAARCALLAKQFNARLARYRQQLDARMREENRT